MIKHAALLLATVACAAFSTLAHAESNVVTTGNAAAHLDFKVTIPAVLFLRVGTGALPTAMANNTTIDLIDFTVPSANVGDGTSIAASATAGDLTNGAVTVRVYGNGGNGATLNSTTTGQLTSAAGDTIPWTQITATAAALTATTAGYTNTGITHPTFNNGASGGSGTATALTGAGKLVRAESKWTFAYNNTAVYPAGTYGGANTQNGRVTYTLSQP